MNPSDTILPGLVDSAFPIVKEVPCSMDYLPLFWIPNLVVYSGSAERTEDTDDD